MKRLLTHDVGYRAGVFLVWVFLWPALARESPITRLDSLMENRLYDRALDEVHSALKETHDKAESATLSFYEGGILFKLGRKTEACEVFLKVLKQQPDAILPLKLRSEFQQELEALRPEIKIRQLRENLQYEPALDEVSARLREKPGRDEENRLHLYEAILLYELIRKDEGQKRFREVLEQQIDAQLPVEDISPKIQNDFELTREQVRSKPTQPSRVQQYARIPAIAGGALAMVGGTTLLSNTPFRSGQQVAGISMLCVGTAGLLTAVFMYVLDSPPNKTQSAISVGTNGTSAFVSVRWP